MVDNFPDSWRSALSDEFSKPYFRALSDFVAREYEYKTIYPAKEDIFRALEKCPFDNVRIVLIGQDPYHGPGQAHGLSFSVPDGVALPPSLVNIFKEAYGGIVPQSGNLERWASQGVLLLNSVLTVEAHKAGSHQKQGWECFTDAIITALSNKKEGLVYILWGNHAQKKARIVDEKTNCILKSVHPSPLSVYRGFMGCGHFVAANEYLKSRGENPIEW